MKALRCFAGLLAALVCSAVGAQAPDADQSWTCVPGDNGRWRCGEGAAEPETSPLPELPEPAATAPPPSIFILEQPQSNAGTQASASAEPVVPAGHPLLGKAEPAGPFALKIASVSRVEEIPGFVEDYGLDPTLVRYVEVDEAGASRQLILWGAFASASQANRAVNGLPGVVRAVRPQVVRADRFDDPPRMLLAMDGPAPATPGAADPAAAPVAPDQPRRQVAAVPSPPLGETAAPIAVREPAPEPEPESEPEARTPAGPADAEPAPRIAASEPEPASTPRPSTPVFPEPETEPVPAPPPSPPVAAEPTPRHAAREPKAEPAAAATAPPAAEPIASRAEPERAAPAPERVTLRPLPAVATTSPPRGPTAAPTAARTRADPTPSAGAVAGPPPGRTADEFRALTADGYTVQLTSLRDAALIGRFLRRHGLDPDRVYRIRVDEGAGPRWLLLWEWYPSLELAEAGREALPASIRSPWVRRVGPLSDRLGDGG